MAKTTRPRVKVGEWLECWAYGKHPRYGRVRGVVTKIDRHWSRYRGHHVTFEMAINNDYKEPIPELYYCNEIVRRLKPHEIVITKLKGIYESEYIS